MQGHEPVNNMQIGHSSYVVSLAVLPPGSSPVVPGLGLLSGSRDTTVRIWDIETGQFVCSMSGHKHQVNAVGALSGGEVASGGLDGALKVWKAGKVIRTLEEHDGPILALIVLKNGDILTGALCTCTRD
jgi:WD40 repeat protein